jgi:hypothetical protein
MNYPNNSTTPAILETLPTELACPVCGAQGSQRDDGTYGCKCGAGYWCPAVTPDRELEERLEIIGFEYSPFGDHYVLLRFRHSLSFYADGTWHSNKAERNETLEEYLNRVTALMSQPD